MNRRALLASAAPVSVGVVSGCLGRRGVGADGSGGDDWDPAEVDCRSGAGLPDPPDPASDDAVSPFDYPEPPDPTSETALLEYVETFEEAYVGNEYVRSAGDSLTHFGLNALETDIVSSGDNWAVVRLEYEYTETLEYDDDEQAAGTSGLFVATYAVTPTWIRRTVDEGRDAEPPDPRETGTLLECFDE